MALISRLANWFDRMLGTLEGADDALDGAETEGFLMPTPEASSLSAPSPVDSPPTLGLPFAVPGAAEPAVAPAPAEAPAPPPLRAVSVPAQALEIDADAKEPPGDGPAEIEGGSEEPDDSAVEEAPPEPAAPPGSEASADQPVTVTATAAPDEGPTVAKVDSVDDMLSAFRDVSSGGEFQELTKELEDVTAQDLLSEARAIRDLLGPAPETTDSAA
jgi:hypothetical protein